MNDSWTTRYSVDPGSVVSARSASSTGRTAIDVGNIAEVCTNDEVAARLGISHNTARSHVSSVLDKPDVDSRISAVAAARERGLLPSC